MAKCLNLLLQSNQVVGALMGGAVVQYNTDEGNAAMAELLKDSAVVTVSHATLTPTHTHISLMFLPALTQRGHASAGAISRESAGDLHQSELMHTYLHACLLACVPVFHL